MGKHPILLSLNISMNLSQNLRYSHLLSSETLHPPENLNYNLHTFLLSKNVTHSFIRNIVFYLK